MRKKKWLRGVMAMAVAGSLLISAAPGSLQAPKASAAVKLTGKTKKVAYRNTFVGKHGRLRVKGTKLVDKKAKRYSFAEYPVMASTGMLESRLLMRKLCEICGTNGALIVFVLQCIPRITMDTA